MEELEDLVLQGKSVLDVGCGTGILAVASLLLGTLPQLPDPLKKPFDVILANIYPEVLKGIAQDIRALSKSGTVLVASGVLWEDNHEIVKLYRDLGFELVKNRWLDNYTTFVMRMP